MSAAVVIPSWNSLTLLSRCLESLREDQGAETELLIVDNGSSDGSVEYLEREGIPHISLQENFGFAGAVNLGVRATESDAVFVLNADTIVEQGSITVLLDALAADRQLGGVQPLILQLQGDQPAPVGHSPTVYSVGQSLTKDGRGFEEGAGELQASGHMDRREVFGVCGAACLLRRELFSEVGGYDETYVSFYEDVDLNIRARIAGWTFEFVPEALVWHVGNAVWRSQFADPAAENARLVARNRLATQIKYMPATALPRIAAVECGSLVKSVVEHRFMATAAGKLEGLRRLPALRRERRQLRENGNLAAARAWLGRGRRSLARG